MRYFKKYTFLHCTSLHKIVSEWSIKPMETIKSDLEVVWISPQKLAKSQNTKNPMKTEKSKISIILLYCLKLSIRYTSAPNFIQIGPKLTARLVAKNKYIQFFQSPKSGWKLKKIKNKQLQHEVVNPWANLCVKLGNNHVLKLAHINIQVRT